MTFRQHVILALLSLALICTVQGVVSWRNAGGSATRGRGPRRSGPAAPSPTAVTKAVTAIPQFQPQGVGQGMPLPPGPLVAVDPAAEIAGSESGDPSPNPSPACTARPAFLRYDPSPWEAEWAARLATASSNASSSFCDAARAEGDRAARLLAWTAAVANASAAPPPPPPDLTSSLVYTCTVSSRPPTNATWAEPIEPLVGLLRHPYAVPRCAPPGVAAVHIEDRSYLVLRRAAWAGGPPALPAPASTPPPPPPQSFLFDAGANAYASSLAWLIDRYAALGTAFDEVFAWEAALPLNATWWAAVPPGIAPRLHAYGAPVALHSAMDPVAWMRRLARPGDTVVFKLDVGAGQTERAFVEEIAGSWTAGVPYVLEFFYEFHFNDPALQPWFGPPGPDTLTLADAAAALKTMRESGVRAHYWP